MFWVNLMLITTSGQDRPKINLLQRPAIQDVVGRSRQTDLRPATAADQRQWASDDKIGISRFEFGVRMSWVGISDDLGSRFSALGLGHKARAGAADPDSLLTRGSLMIELAPIADGQPQTLLAYSTATPWPAGLRLFHAGNGRIVLDLWQGPSKRRYVLSDALPARPAPLIVTYVWDAPARHALLAAYEPGAARLVMTEATAPFPMRLADAERLVSVPGARVQNAAVRFLALADTPEPVGPAPTLAAHAMVETRDGPLPICHLDPGAVVLTADGDTAQVTWVGVQEMPARGRFRPLLMRAPYHGLTRDLVVSPAQGLRLAGSDVEYAFGTETVAVAAGDLTDDRSVLPLLTFDVVRYYQILLDKPAVLRISGAPMVPFDVAALLDDPSFLRHSVLVDLPRELIPAAGDGGLQLLESYEVLSLRRFGRPS